MLPVKDGSLFQVLGLTPKMLLSYKFKLLDISHLLLNMGDMGRTLQKDSIFVHTNSGK